MIAMAKELFDVVQSGAVKININQTYPLKDVSKAHRDLEARKTTGSTRRCCAALRRGPPHRAR
jgi:NADPH:quinone reductase